MHAGSPKDVGGRLGAHTGSQVTHQGHAPEDTH